MKRFSGLVLFYYSLVQQYVGMIVLYVVLLHHTLTPIQKAAEYYFSTRELAMIILIVTYISFVCIISKTTRMSLIAAIRAVFSIKNFKALAFIAAYLGYIGLLFYFGFIYHLWDTNLLGTLFIWSSSSGLVLLYSVFSPKVESPFRLAVKNTLGLAAIFTFISGIFTFSLPLEIILVVSLLLASIGRRITLNDASIAGTFGANQIIKVTNYIILIIVVAQVVHSIIGLVSVIVNNSNDDSDAALIFGKFMLPIIMASLALPFMYAAMIYSRYENLFARMSAQTGRPVHLYFKLAIVSICLLSVKKLPDLQVMALSKTGRLKNQGDSFRDARQLLTAKNGDREDHLSKGDGSNPAKGIFPLKEDGQPWYSAVTLEYPQGKAFVEGFRAIFPHFPEEMYRKDSRFILRVAQVVSSDLQVARDPLPIVNSVKLRIEHDLKKYVHDSIAIVSEADAVQVFNLAIDTVCPEFTDRKL